MRRLSSGQSHAGASRRRASAKRWRQFGRGRLSPLCATPSALGESLEVLHEENAGREPVSPLVRLRPQEDSSLIVALRVREVALVGRARVCPWLQALSSLVPRLQYAFGPGAKPLRPAAPSSCHRVRPNPSLEPTRTGMALGPRGRGSYHRPRGPSAIPALAPQLKR